MNNYLENIIKNLRKELILYSRKKFVDSVQRFFKYPVKCYGVKAVTVRKIAKRLWVKIRILDKREIFGIFERLLISDFLEEAFIVSYLCPKLKDKFEKEDLDLFEIWIDKHINNWAKCDGFCTRVIGAFIMKYPESLKKIELWTRSKNQWLRRASAVSLIVSARQGRYIENCFNVADKLLNDKEDMVQKGYGWLLKEVSKKYKRKVFDFVLKRKNIMPRASLRYAIELMPKKMKMQVMKKK